MTLAKLRHRFCQQVQWVLWPKIGTLKEWEHFLDLSLIFGLMRIAAMTNICDWIKEFSSYIKLGVSGAGNKYSVWLQFEWLQCCSAQSPGSWSYLRCRELQWQRPGKGTISHDPPDTGGIIIIIWCDTVWWPGSDQCCMSRLSGAGRGWARAGGPWPDLNSSARGCERLRLRQQAGRPLSHWLVRPPLALAWLKPQVSVSNMLTRC